MGKQYLSTKYVRERFDEKVNVSPVTESVYLVTDPDGTNKRYAKIWSEKKRDILTSLMSIKSDIGLPNCRVIEGKQTILVMEPASGKKLPNVFLKSLLPGLWSIRNEQLLCAINDLGRTVGRLHTATHSGVEELTPHTISFDTYEVVSDGLLASPISGLLTKSTVNNINQRLSTLSDYDVPVSIVHGDLMLFHIYIDGKETELIDFDAAKRVPYVDDLVRFSCALELFIRRLPYGRTDQYKKIWNAFKKGYNETGISYCIVPQLWDTLRTIRYCTLLMYYYRNLRKDLHKKENYSNVDRLKLHTLRRMDSFLLKRIINELAM